MKITFQLTAFLFLAMVSSEEDTQYTNMWIVEVHGGEEVAKRLASDLGFICEGKASWFKDHYVFTRNDIPKLSTRGDYQLTKALQAKKEVKWVEQQYLLEREPRGYISHMEQDNNHIYSDDSKVGTFSTKPSAGDGTLDTYQGPTKNIQLISTKPSAYGDEFNDPMWPRQWYVQDYRTKAYPVMDHNVVPVYKKGITGKGVIVAIVDDGVQDGHPDLEGNYNVSLSRDVCNDKPGSEPNPPTAAGKVHSHGTRCAGMVAMLPDNNKCGVGVAYEATVAGIKTLCKGTVPFSEAVGLTHELEHMDVYSCSWGPSDSGSNMQAMSRMTSLAIDRGVTEGRNGKGAIYTFAAGNGRRKGDNCAADANVNHVHTIGVAAAGQDGKWSVYSERCAAVFTTAYSSTGGKHEKTVATLLDGKCTIEFTGTSSATPLVSGIIALALQANPDLSHRDVMHLITMSSEVAPVANNKDSWYKNGQGFWVSNDFGFGLLNAENMVTLAKDWNPVPKMNSCTVSLKLTDSVEFNSEHDFSIKVRTMACQETESNSVEWLEQVVLTVDIFQRPGRGLVSIFLTSPAGTESIMMEPRYKDVDARYGFKDWSMKSVSFWGENPKGTWKIRVTTKPGNIQPGYVKKLTLAFHGTRDMPTHYQDLPRGYAEFRLPEGQTSNNISAKMKM